MCNQKPNIFNFENAIDSPLEIEIIITYFITVPCFTMRYLVSITYWCSWRSRRGRSWGPCCRTPRTPSADQSEMSTAALHQSQLTWTGSVSLVAPTAAPAAPAAVRAAEVTFIFSSSIFYCRSAGVLIFFSSSGYYHQKCRVSSVLHVIICCRGTQWDSWFCNISGCGAARMTSYKSNVTTGRSCTKTAKFKFAPDRCSDRGANQQLQNAVTLLTNPIY